MGVTGLWTVLQPCARPIKIETLNKKRLAVDASIWIYQFLKAVRDKEGNALRNSHIVGFFRRICKLLFIGIQPVFVFDGGAPALKRQTISNRRSRREGKREDALRTAGKLLAKQMLKAAEEEEKRRKNVTQQAAADDGQEEIPENLVYASEVLQTPQERAQNRKFRKKDQYDLPDLGASLAELGGPNDPRIMSLEELEDYARQFDTGEDINVYDFSKIDFDSPFFTSLPPSDRYNILNAARLRSRLRLGYSKDQLDQMFPDRMAFSKFQIDRVRERNELTQRLMNINGMSDDPMYGANLTNRIAGDKGREYVLVKNDGVEGGWALGVVTNKEEGKAEKPIDVDLPPPANVDEEDVDSEEDFEDVPIEGLNRLPKARAAFARRDRQSRDFISQEVARRRQKLYKSRKQHATQKVRSTPRAEDPESLFLAEDSEAEAEVEGMTTEDNELFEDVPPTAGDHEEEDHLQQAIALSLGHDDREEVDVEETDDRVPFQQERAKEANPFASNRASGRKIANLANVQSSKMVPAVPFGGSESESEDEMNLQAALRECRKSKRPASVQRPTPRATNDSTQTSRQPPSKPSNAAGFDGPLPFEKLNLGNSLLGKKKMEKLVAESAGGFEKDTGSDTKPNTEPLPPWFAGTRDIDADLDAQRADEKQEWERARKDNATFEFAQVPRLRRHETKEVINVDEDDAEKPSQDVQMVEIVNDNDSDSAPSQLLLKSTNGGTQPLTIGGQSSQGDQVHDSDDEPVEWSESEPEDGKTSMSPASHSSTQSVHETKIVESTAVESASGLDATSAQTASLSIASPSKPVQDEVELAEETIPHGDASPSPDFEEVPINLSRREEPGQSPSPDFEDVPIGGTADVASSARARIASPAILQGPSDLEVPIVDPSTIVAEDVEEELPENDSDQYSDPEDAELFASLAKEAEEHARFAQQLNQNNSARINFDEELKQLRNQQKKDRRDADEVTQTMVAECQHLLALFGLPYVTAPMEAEAQCAALVDLGLVDGIVTDDSDTFLFGGTRVYKNMFNAAKFVECYLTNDLVSEFALSREKLIDIAQLLGSDYTTGIPGIGPVTALEILSEFSTLSKFRDWWTAVQNGTITKQDDASSPFRRRFRRSQSTKLFLPTGFPDPRVTEAYLNPDVDADPQPFQWGVPDLDALRTFLSSQIGWSWERTDEVLVPVIKDMTRREKEGTQANITRFFDGGVGAGAFAPRNRGNVVRNTTVGPTGEKKGRKVAGRRLGAALERLKEMETSRDEGEGDDEEDSRADAGEEGHGSAMVANGRAHAATTTKRRKRASKKTDGHAGTADHSGSDDDDNDDDEAYIEPKKKRPRKGKRNAG